MQLLVEAAFNRKRTPMTLSHDTPRYPDPHHATVDSGPTFTGLDILGGLVAAVMLLLPLTAAATHYSHQGWPTEKSDMR